VALRAPAHPVMRALLDQIAFPLAAPSANRSGFVSPTTAEHVLASLDGRIDLVLDGGACASGLESTIIAVRDDGRIEELRPGPVAGLALPDGSAKAANTAHGDRVEAPGQLASHYSPGKPVRLNAKQPETDEFMIGFGAISGDCNLSDAADLAQAGAQLYACLHQAAGSVHPRVAVAPIPNTGIGHAINDRLRRAAA
jgi:L-threonylcarbamoyladenylate synthase